MHSPIRLQLSWRLPTSYIPLIRADTVISKRTLIYLEALNFCETPPALESPLSSDVKYQVGRNLPLLMAACIGYMWSMGIRAGSRT